jgi:hypothetical protein
VLPAALGVGVSLRLNIPIRPIVWVAIFLVAAFIIFIQLSRAGRWEAEARRSRRRLLDEEEAEVWEPTINNVVVPELFATSGLSDLFDPQYEVSTAATRDLREALSRLRAGSFGIAGARGAGKTTLIQAACNGQLDLVVDPGNAGGRDGGESTQPQIGVAVSAPVPYEAREFVHHLFGELSLKVRGALPGDKVESTQFQRAGRVVLALSGLIVSIYFYLNARITAAASIAIRLRNMYSGALRSREQRFESGSIQAEAERNLQRLHYLETRANEWSGGISMSPIKLGGTANRSLASQPLTLPELSSLYEQFVRKITAERSLVIGIDELDKMASAQEVRRFLNDIKSLLGQPGTYYLVSVSEEAMSAFERRGLPIRDVFDSVFDDILHVGYLTLKESESLLQRRVIGMGPPFTALCHCMAGGLPRELIRCARKAVAAAEDAPGLADVAAAIVSQRVRSQQRAVEVAMWPQVDRDGRQPVVRWLNSLPDLERCADPKATAAALLERCEVGAVLEGLGVESATEGGRSEAEMDVKPRLAAIQLASSWYQAATLLEFFIRLDGTDFAGDRKWSEEEERELALLCRAQQELSTSVELAWGTVSQIRELLELIPVLSFPGQGGDAADQALALGSA